MGFDAVHGDSDCPETGRESARVRRARGRLGSKARIGRVVAGRRSARPPLKSPSRHVADGTVIIIDWPWTLRRPSKLTKKKVRFEGNGPPSVPPYWFPKVRQLLGAGEQPRVEHAVSQVVVQTAAQVLRAGLGDDVDLTRARRPQLRGIAGRFDLELADGIGRQVDDVRVERGIGVGGPVDPEGVRAWPSASDADGRVLAGPPVERQRLAGPAPCDVWTPGTSSASSRNCRPLSGRFESWCSSITCPTDASVRSSKSTDCRTTTFSATPAGCTTTSTRRRWFTSRRTASSVVANPVRVARNT